MTSKNMYDILGKLTALNENAKSVTEKAKTKNKGLPEKVDEEMKDYDIPTKLRRDRGDPELDPDDVMPDREVPELDDDQRRKIKTSMPAAKRKEMGIKLDIKDVKGPGDKPWAQKLMKSVRDDFLGNEYQDMKESKRNVKEGRYFSEDESQLDAILRRFPYEVKRLEKEGSLDYDGPLYDALFDYYHQSGEMPYNVAKGRDGSPYEWVLDKIQSYLGSGDDLDIDTEFDDGLDDTAEIGSELDDGIDSMDSEVGSGDSLDDLARLAGISESKIDECGEAMITNPGNPANTTSSFRVSSTYSSDGQKSINISADGDSAEELANIIKMAGLLDGNTDTSYEYPNDYAGEYAQDDGYQDNQQMTVRVAEEYANEPDEEVMPVDVITKQGNDLNRPKKQYASKPRAGDNPMAEESDDPTDGMEHSFKKAYESIKRAKGTR